MNILQRRGKRTPLTQALSARSNRYKSALWSRWQGLSPRDQLALSILLLFLLLFVGGYGGYSVQQAAKASKANYQEQVTDYFWLRAQAGNIDPTALNATDADGTTAMPPASRVNASLQTSGINNAQVIAAGEGVQFSFSHPSQAVVSATLANLEQQGWQYTQLSIQQDSVTRELQVQATVAL